MNRLEYNTFRGKNAEVAVYSETKEHAEIFGNKRRLDINWSCCGAVSIVEAEEFCKNLQEAIKYAKIKKKEYQEDKQ